MNYDEKDVNILLEKWYETKEQISSLEKKLDKYKKYAEKIMDNNDLDSLSSSTFSLTKREMSRNILSKDDVPPEVWNKYSRNITYPMFVIRKKKDKK
jgi:hypothetical protein